MSATSALSAAAVLLGLSACEKLPTDPAAVRPGAVRGVTFVDWSADGYADPAAAGALQALAATGANTVVVIVTAYQSDAASSALRAADPRTPTRAAIIEVLDQVKTLGLRLAIGSEPNVQTSTQLS